MKLLNTIAVCIGYLAISGCAHVANIDKVRLPDNYTVLPNQSENTLNNNQNVVRAILPVENSYQKNPGCYIACYSHNPQGVYSISPTVFVEGLMRVKGSYEGVTCKPA